MSIAVEDRAGRPFPAEHNGSAPGGLTSAAPRAVALMRAWLWLLAALVFAMVVVGGATRLTGSGLSITEWRPVTGAIPPLTQEAWEQAFALYKQIPQYKLLNLGMSLSEFKEIYWWEWSHRQLGRTIGLVFALGFAAFWMAGALRGRFALAVAGAGALGGLQGAIGWIMVASGLREGMIAVAPVKLMLHLTTASIILVVLVSLALAITPARRLETAPARARPLAGLVVVATLVQIALGALVAGSKAGWTYNTWPMMDGEFWPPLAKLFIGEPWFENLVDNPLTVQFNHRMMAYGVLALALAQAAWLWRVAAGSPAAKRAAAVLALVLSQAVLGIATLLAQVPLSLGLAHQAVAMLVLAMAVVHWRRTPPTDIQR